MSAGLEGIVVAETRLSRVDGIAGRLIVAGHDVEDLVADWSLPDVAALLWNEYADTPRRGDQVASDLGRARLIAADLVPRLLRVSGGATPVEALRTGWSLLNDNDPKKHGIDNSALLTGAAPVFVAAHWRHSNNTSVIAPDPERGHAADFLAMLGLNHEALSARALERYLITIADHGMNASTFTARAVASTQAGEISAVVAALCALKGPLHGGAPGPVLDMLDEIASESDITPWIHAALAEGSRLMGFGHRVYRTRDPRADWRRWRRDTLIDASIPMSSSIPPWPWTESVCRASCLLRYSRWAGSLVGALILKSKSQADASFVRPHPMSATCRKVRRRFKWRVS